MVDYSEVAPPPPAEDLPKKSLHYQAGIFKSYGRLKGPFFHIKPLYWKKMDGINNAQYRVKIQNNPPKAHLY